MKQALLSMILTWAAIFSFGIAQAQQKNIEEKKSETEIPIPPKPPKVADAPMAPPPPPPPPPHDMKEVFRVVEEMPRFPGCEDSSSSSMEKDKCAKELLYQYIGSSLKYPEDARKAGVEGKAIVQFVVSKHGNVESIVLLRDPGAGCGDASLGVFIKMVEDEIKWIPGKQRGKSVDVQLIIPVQFKL